MVLTQTVKGRERYGVRVRYPRELRGNPADLKQMSLTPMAARRSCLEVGLLVSVLSALRGSSEAEPNTSTPNAVTVQSIPPLPNEYEVTRNSTQADTSIWNWQPNDCSPCNDKCEWNDLVCHRDKVACNAYQSIMAFLMKAIDIACETDPKKLDRRDLIGDAKEMLDEHDIFALGDLDGVIFHFCNFDAANNEWLERATGLTVSSDKVIFEYNYLNASVEDLAILMAHEMVHIKQYRRWGSQGYFCRYMKEIDDGKGFGPENYIEKEAYDLEYVTASIIKNE
jgi:hypothetical protein